jgi:hypothetical protein
LIGAVARVSSCLVLFSDFTNHPAGIACGEHAVGNVAGYNASRADHCSRANTDARQCAAEAMKTERQKMLAGELYDPMDPELVEGRARARDLCQLLNASCEAGRC